MSKTYAPIPENTGFQRNAQIQSPKQSFKASRRRGGGAKAEAPSFRKILQSTAQSISKGDKTIDRTLKALRRGRGQIEPQKLMEIQFQMYRRMEQLEFFGRATDKATTALRTTLQSQQ